jgi:hypothetical protein
MNCWSAVLVILGILVIAALCLAIFVFAGKLAITMWVLAVIFFALFLIAWRLNHWNDFGIDLG